MNRIGILLVLAWMAEAGAYAEEYDESLHENDNKNVYLEIPMLGHALAFLYPSRIFSVKVDVTRQFGVYAEPVLGHQAITGYGIAAGAYYRNGKNFNGLKYVFLDLERYGALNEYFYDYHRYLKTSPGINLRFGFAIGLGMTKFSENRQGDRSMVEFGPTFRLHLDLSYLLKYN